MRVSHDMLHSAPASRKARPILSNTKWPVRGRRPSHHFTEFVHGGGTCDEHHVTHAHGARESQAILPDGLTFNCDSFLHDKLQ
jgi:hypothetical protein